MAWGDTAGIHTPYPYSNANAIPPDVFRMAIDYFPNRTPLLYWLSKLPLDALTFYQNDDTYRPRTDVLTAAYTSTGTSLTVADTTGYDVGDVLQIESENFYVTAIANATTLTVVGASQGTSQANHANNTAITLITNAATGGEVDKNALSRLPATTAQYAQTVQHAYQVGGSLQSTANFMGGQITPLDRDRMMALQHCMDDFESAMYFGVANVFSSTVTRQTMGGFKSRCTTNKVTSPTNGSAYKPSDFTRDVLKAPFASGGQPNLVLVSTDFLTGLSTWGFTLQRLDAGVTALGVQPDVFYVPFLGGVRLVPAPLLPTGSAIALNTMECRIRIKRQLYDKPRGSRGDATEGDMIMEGAIEIENQSHQAWVSGVTGYAVQS